MPVFIFPLNSSTISSSLCSEIKTLSQKPNVKICIIGDIKQQCFLQSKLNGSSFVTFYNQDSNSAFQQILKENPNCGPKDIVVVAPASRSNPISIILNLLLYLLNFLLTCCRTQNEEQNAEEPNWQQLSVESQRFLFMAFQEGVDLSAVLENTGSLKMDIPHQNNYLPHFNQIASGINLNNRDREVIINDLNNTCRNTY